MDDSFSDFMGFICNNYEIVRSELRKNYASSQDDGITLSPADVELITQISANVSLAFLRAYTEWHRQLHGERQQ